MSEKLRPVYHGIKKSCEIWNCDSNEAHHRIKTQNMRVYVYPKGTNVFEGKLNGMDKTELSRFRKLAGENKLSEEVLKEEGYTITEVQRKFSDTKRFLAKKGSAEIIIFYTDMRTPDGGWGRLWGLDYEETLHPAKTINHHVYYELCEQTINNHLDDLFLGKKIHVSRVRCEREGHAWLVIPACSISLEDIYLCHEDSNVDAVVLRRLKISLKENIHSINPGYLGKIYDKTSPPQKLILKVMCMMFELHFPAITWQTVKDFIEENILGITEHENLCRLEYINDFEIKVDNVSALKENCQKIVSKYKKDVFFNPSAKSNI